LKYEQKLDDNVKNENALKILSRQVGSKNVELVDRLAIAMGNSF
jgi:hypothetical protein